MNETGTVDFAGTEKRFIIKKELGEEITLDELTPGSVYNVRVKVIFLFFASIVLKKGKNYTRGK